MSETGREPHREASSDAARKPSAQRLREVFGDVLPETTSDEREPGPPADAADRDEWFRANRPPHH